MVGSNGAILKNTPPGPFEIQPGAGRGVVSGVANYPNPFNPATTIAFSLTRPTTVKITVFDILGRSVVTLLNDEPLDAGPHAVVFDTREVRGRDLASGVYLYRVVTGDGLADETKKMMLLK